MAMTIGLDLLFKLFMLFPIWILAIKVNERHAFLVTTIEPMPEEIEAHWLINFLAIHMVWIFLVGAGLQYLTYYMYNNWFHPLQVLVANQGMT